MQSRYEDIKKKQPHPPYELWQPSINDILIGEIVETIEDVSTKYGLQNQLIVKNEDGALIRTWLTEWLLNELRNRRAEIGDLIALTYLGKGTARGGRYFNRYSLIIDY